ncbi:MAG: hypothetical protein M5R42_01980 [Rhodocyclaceae bacterium]|nr:hypothetical protein [Rhodocyclaceae bacterium]
MAAENDRRSLQHDLMGGPDRHAPYTHRRRSTAAGQRSLRWFDAHVVCARPARPGCAARLSGLCSTPAIASELRQAHAGAPRLPSPRGRRRQSAEGACAGSTWKYNMP